MAWRLVKWLTLVSAIVALPLAAYAQEATISGSVTDQTGGVLPGVTITATHVDTGNTFVAVTDERGTFRLPVRTGSFRIAVELPGFATLNRTVELLVGQNAVVNLQMVPSTVQESVTVTGESPLIDTTSSTMGGNIDPRQMQELPVNGRNFMDLTLLTPGSRLNAVNETPVAAQTSEHREPHRRCQRRLDLEPGTAVLDCEILQPSNRHRAFAILSTGWQPWVHGVRAAARRCVLDPG